MVGTLPSIEGDLLGRIDFFLMLTVHQRDEDTTRPEVSNTLDAKTDAATLICEGQTCIRGTLLIFSFSTYNRRAIESDWQVYYDYFLLGDMEIFCG